MKQIRDAVVIGSGIIGSATALAMMRVGVRRVTLVEKGPLVSGMTRRSAGLVHPFHAHPLLCELASASYPLYSQWAVQLGGKSAFVETGAAAVALRDADARARFDLWQEHAGNANPIAPDALNALYPGVSRNFRAAMFTPDGGYADAVLTAQALVNAAKERGLETQTGTQVKQIVVEQRQIKGVKTTTGELEAPVVVVAAGSWTERLLNPLGIALRLRFYAGVVEFYEQPPTLTRELPLLLDSSGEYFFRSHPYRMGAAGRVSPQAQPQGVDTLNEFVSVQDTSNVNQFVASCIPAFAGVSPKRAHTVMYDTPGDGLPALGRVGNFNGLYVAAGFGTSAFSVAPAVGETLAQMLVDGSAARDISVFDPLRAALRN